MNQTTKHKPARPPLVDSFGRAHSYLRISVTDRCNLRCEYCMPEKIVFKPRAEILTYEEIVRITRLFAEMGVDKIRLTGGEPLLRRDLPQLVKMLRALPGIREIAMTTNATLLTDCAAELKAAGLSLLNISLDSLRSERFKQITRRDDFGRVLAGIDAALAAGFAPLKINCVVMGGVNDDELPDFVELAREQPLEVRFIEFMPFQDNHWDVAEMVPYAEMLRRIRACFDLRPLSRPARSSEVARDYTIAGFRGRIGFITSMTEDFCGDCNRVRLLADGGLKSCLFYPPEDNLRLALRAGAGDGELEAIIRRVIAHKKSGHAPLEELARLPNNAMIQIGG